MTVCTYTTLLVFGAAQQGRFIFTTPKHYSQVNISELYSRVVHATKIKWRPLRLLIRIITCKQKNQGLDVVDNMKEEKWLYYPIYKQMGIIKAGVKFDAEKW